MDSGGIAGKAGIWRASWRKTLVDHILACSEHEAHASAKQLTKWCPCAVHIERERRLVAEAVRGAMSGQRTPDDHLRHAIMENVISVMGDSGAVSERLELALVG